MKNAQAYAEQFRTLFDLSDAAETQRRNLETFNEINQRMLGNVQELFRRQAELAQANTQEVFEASRDVLSSGTPEAGISKQAELAKSIFAQSVENAREVTEMMTKSGFEAFDLLNQAASENLDKAQKKAKATKRK